jgi:hypothetical protein
MDKRIGTASVYGAIYLSTVKNVDDLLVVSKVASHSKDNLTEVLIMEQLTEKLVKRKKTKHFPLLYTSHLCPKKKGNLTLVSVNELCNGDLKMLVENPEISNISDETLVNIIYQIFVSLMTFNNFGYIHMDTHWGNFLYQNNSEKGYYEYQYKSKTFFLPACPYNIMLYDFGLSKKLKSPNNPDCFNEFVRPLYAFLPEKTKYNGWNSFIKVRAITDAINQIKRELYGYSTTKTGKFNVFELILDKLNEKFGNMIYKNKLRPQDIILNDKPFIIA